MDESEVRASALELVEQSVIAMVGTLGEDGSPQIKAMIKAEHEGLKTIWFSTNTSSEHVGQLERDPRACVYFAQWGEEPWRGLTLGGRMEILKDRASRERLWEDGSEKFYSKGIDDPDYTVLRFVPDWGKYWQFRVKVRFDLP
jgi:general stress protein 26